MVLTAEVLGKRWDLLSDQQSALKWGAIGLMLVDHIGAVLYPEVLGFRVVGRLAFPLFAFLIAYNLEVRQVYWQRYVLPLAVAGLISQPIYAWVFGFGFSLNIMWALLIGVLLFEATRRGGWIAPAALLLAFGASFWIGYGFAGLLLVPVFGWWLRDRTVWALVAASVVVVALNWGPLALIGLLVWPVLVLAGRARGLPRGPAGLRWFFFAFYPAHLVVLEIVRRGAFVS